MDAPLINLPDRLRPFVRGGRITALPAKRAVRLLLLDQVAQAFEPGRRLFDSVVDIPELQGNPAARLDARAMMPNLTRDVLVHTWDLARAVGADDWLDPQCCEHFYAMLPTDTAALSVSGMFDAPVAVGDQTDVQSKLLARLGRDPSWQPEVSRFPCVTEPRTGPE